MAGSYMETKYADLGQCLSAFIPCLMKQFQPECLANYMSILHMVTRYTGHTVGMEFEELGDMEYQKSDVCNETITPQKGNATLRRITSSRYDLSRHVNLCEYIAFQNSCSTAGQKEFLERLHHVVTRAAYRALWDILRDALYSTIPMTSIAKGDVNVAAKDDGVETLQLTAVNMVGIGLLDTIITYLEQNKCGIPSDIYMVLPSSVIGLFAAEFTTMLCCNLPFDISNDGVYAHSLNYNGVRFHIYREPYSGYLKRAGGKTEGLVFAKSRVGLYASVMASEVMRLNKNPNVIAHSTVWGFSTVVEARPNLTTLPYAILSIALLGGGRTTDHAGLILEFDDATFAGKQLGNKATVVASPAKKT